MLRHILIFLILSLLVVIFAPYVHLVIHYITATLQLINTQISPFFSLTTGGVVLRKTVILILIPIVIAAIPALIYRLIKKKNMPHFIALVWIIWTILVLSDLLVR